ncbi:UNKNOWN [Stylonychia lemnae]|uniref:Uncharacterized protein n=1 Tax=Stylonychia lemnae TaxID=5949 RepID=A0A078AH64_STYLE|nr:UNKNOWN [Stylonychia lemnae]|eukprot:CDW81171.1 UNKNOWN [Stylonychia lemnae]
MFQQVANVRAKFLSIIQQKRKLKQALDQEDSLTVMKVGKQIRRGKTAQKITNNSSITQRNEVNTVQQSQQSLNELEIKWQELPWNTGEQILIINRQVQNAGAQQKLHKFKRKRIIRRRFDQTVYRIKLINYNQGTPNQQKIVRGKKRRQLKHHRSRSQGFNNTYSKSPLKSSILSTSANKSTTSFKSPIYNKSQNSIDHQKSFVMVDFEDEQTDINELFMNYKKSQNSPTLPLNEYDEIQIGTSRDLNESQLKMENEMTQLFNVRQNLQCIKNCTYYFGKKQFRLNGCSLIPSIPNIESNIQISSIALRDIHSRLDKRQRQFYMQELTTGYKFSCNYSKLSLYKIDILGKYENACIGYLSVLKSSIWITNNQFKRIFQLKLVHHTWVLQYPQGQNQGSNEDLINIFELRYAPDHTVKINFPIFINWREKVLLTSAVLICQCK